MPNPLVQCCSLFLSNQIQLYKPNSTGKGRVILPADAWAHPATGAPRAWAQSATPQTATQTLAIMHHFTHSSLHGGVGFVSAVTHPSLSNVFLSYRTCNYFKDIKAHTTGILQCWCSLSTILSEIRVHILKSMQ